MRHKQNKLKEQIASVKKWNLEHEVVIPVAVKMDDGSSVNTETRSHAEMLSGHSAVIWLVGITGCYLLDRVTPLDG